MLTSIYNIPVGEISVIVKNVVAYSMGLLASKTIAIWQFGGNRYSNYQYNSSRPENFSSKVRRVTMTPALALSPVRLFETKNYWGMHL